MLDHFSLGVRDLGGARKFYSAVLKPLGYNCLSEDASSLGFGEQGISLWLLAVERPMPADSGSGLHFCFSAPTRAAVDAFHAAALKSGGKSNGKPGVRENYSPTYYAAFVIDPDGYRLEAYCGK